MIEFLHILLHSLLDSLKIFVVIFLFYILLSFFEAKISNVLQKSKKVSPIIGSAIGLIPQCGVSVIASDLYLKKHITIGTLVAIFISCSDEALPILFSKIELIPSALLLILIKFIIGFIVGFTLDKILTKRKEEISSHHEHCHHHHEVIKGCCHHEINNEKDNKWKSHLLHPLIHSLKLLIYIFIVTCIFETIIHFIGEDAISTFLTQNKYLSPLLTTLLGLIPNCASSVIISDLYVLNAIPFGAVLSGLIMNSGLGTIYLLKNKDHRKDTLLIYGILFIVSLLSGYVALLVG